ncbi:serine integrase family protein [Amygdalobacter nucleatus]|uniref:Recombinase n=1 Tax=Amygdalobacter nucleatus TaxID=3029274 RepID=A0A133YD29_9FIRM|nr:hypothetical protein [Amygdalobacter nucleatus]KXB41128.1 recombinase [Amygdalobacter nucleatus]MDF0485122.1 recombinase [Amygdalobacter nucleatus]MDF0486467.1 recombinase [Amygdalobacter nucleatus]MDF0486474.1 recombinase [Amygdalobacter nucleatus]MDF0486484.1 recombinase [Amygdalobacter nucleatus]
MEHTPYGYDIIGGRAVVNEKQAAVIRRICENYLSGMSFIKAAASVGLTMSHCGVKRLIQNERYLGDGFYPPMLTKEMADRVEAERIRREKALGRNRNKGKGAPKGTVYTKFSAPKITLKYEDPVRQAEYAYSLIRNGVNG